MNVLIVLENGNDFQQRLAAGLANARWYVTTEQAENIQVINTKTDLLIIPAATAEDIPLKWQQFSQDYPTTDIIFLADPAQLKKIPPELAAVAGQILLTTQPLEFIIGQIRSHYSDKCLASMKSHLDMLKPLLCHSFDPNSLDTIVNRIIKHAVRTLPADAGFIHLIETRKSTLRLQHMLGISPRKEIYHKFSRRSGKWWQEIRQGRILWFSGEAVTTEIHPMRESGFECVCYVPIIVKKRVLGVLTLVASEEVPRVPGLLNTLELLGFVVGIALTQANLVYERMQKEQELEAVNQELKSFSYTISHDLKAPLVSLYSFADLMREQCGVSITGDADYYLQRILQNAELMHRMLDDLLDLARIGHVNSIATRFSSRRLIIELAAMFEYELRQKGIELRIPAKMPRIFADRDRIAHVFQNLLTNAIKFSRLDANPFIHITGKKRNATEYIFSVEDNGVGIDPVNSDEIFELFHKFGPTDADSTGVGLTIAKKIVEQHGGRIWFESDLDVGTSFYFTLPIEMDK